MDCGKYTGGVYVMGDYRLDRAYMHEDELMLLSKIQGLVRGKLIKKENALLSRIIKSYTRTA